MEQNPDSQYGWTERRSRHVQAEGISCSNVWILFGILCLNDDLVANGHSFHSLKHWLEHLQPQNLRIRFLLVHARTLRIQLDCACIPRVQSDGFWRWDHFWEFMVSLRMGSLHSRPDGILNYVLPQCNQLFLRCPQAGQNFRPRLLTGIPWCWPR